MSQSNAGGPPSTGRSPFGPILRVLGSTIDLIGLGAHRRSGRGVVFLYHRVSAAVDTVYPPTHPGEFDRHCDFISSEFTVVTLAELSERAVQGRSLTGLAAISFDDGYYDFISDAYPVLRRRSLPSTHFLVEGCLRTGLPPWNLRVRCISPGHPLPPHMRPELARLGAVERGRWLEEREAAVKPSYPRMIRPNDLTSVDTALVSWQCHTASHPVLTESPESEIDRELAGSRAAIAEWTGSAVNLLSYPVGKHDARVREAARRAGFRFAYAVGQTRVARGFDAMAIPRIDAGPVRHAALAREISGLNRLLRIRH